MRFFLLFWVCCFYCVPAFADPAFTVKDVIVDVTAESAAEARETAFEEAQGKAFQNLSERLLSAGEVESFPLPDNNTIAGMIESFEVSDERLSDVRYIGNYTFRFSPSAVRSYLGMSGASYTDIGSRPVLILPYYQNAGRTLIWGYRNPWLRAWSEAGDLSSGLVPMTVPIGDLQDVADMADGEALTYEPGGLASIINRYEAGEALIVLAVAEGTDAAEPSVLRVDLYDAIPGEPVFRETVTVERLPEEEAEAFFARAVRDVRENRQTAWKENTIVPADPSGDTGTLGRFHVRVRFTKPAEWAKINGVLGQAPGIRGTEIISLAPRQAMLVLSFAGGEDRLRLALQQAGLSLGPAERDYSAYGFGKPPVYEVSRLGG